MSKALLSICLVGGVFLCVGCGSSGTTMEEMRRRAIKRPKDSDNEDKNASQAERVRQIARERAERGRKQVSKNKPTVAKLHQDPSNGANRVATPSGVAPLRPNGPKAAGDDNDGPAVPLDQLPRVAPPVEPLGISACRERSINNMRRIGEAITDYVRDHNRMPPSAISEIGGTQLLSWRVELLPYLGHADLYAHFRLNEPWDSTHNKKLLEYIPPEFQSPERFDAKTNYLAPIASFAAFNGRRAVAKRSFEDGLESTVVMVEVDDASSVYWTQPADLKVDVKQLHGMLGALRHDGLFVVWGDGSVGRIHKDTLLRDMKASFTIDGGDTMSAFANRKEPPIELPAVAVEQSSALPNRTMAGDGGPKTQNTAVSESRKDELSWSNQTAALPVPSKLDIEESKNLFRDIYETDYKNAQTLEDKVELGKKIFKDAKRIVGDDVGRYVLLDIAIKIAVQAKDSRTALDAAEQLVAEYEVDEVDLLQDTLSALQKCDESRGGSQRILYVAREYLDIALQQDNFDAAETICRAASGAARRLRDGGMVAEMKKWARRIRDAEIAFKRVRNLVEGIEDTANPQTNFEVGHYYCVVRGDWEKGLPLLAVSDRSEFRRAAEKELAETKTLDDEIEIGDLWWDIGRDKDRYRQVFCARAVNWYRQAYPKLPPGLLKIKTEMRIKQFQSAYGVIGRNRRAGS